MLIEQRGRDKLSASSAFHLHTVLDHLGVRLVLSLTWSHITLSALSYIALSNGAQVRFFGRTQVAHIDLLSVNTVFLHTDVKVTVLVHIVLLVTALFTLAPFSFILYLSVENLSFVS